MAAPNGKLKCCVIYAHVSTRDQEPKMQLRELDRSRKATASTARSTSK